MFSLIVCTGRVESSTAQFFMGNSVFGSIGWILGQSHGSIIVRLPWSVVFPVFDSLTPLDSSH